MSYLLYIPFIVVILIYLIFKWKYGFWMNQPVYHLYDISYYFEKPKIIVTSLPEKNRYVNTVNVHTRFMTTLSDTEWVHFVVFLQKYFLRDGNNIYNPKLDNVVPYFKDVKSLCSMYYETIQYKNNTDGSIIVNDRHIVAVMTSRPIFCILYKKHLPVYYVDYLCVSPKKRKCGIAPTIIQTHHYNQRRMVSGIHISLFKREQEMTWIVPLTYYDTHVYDIAGYNLDIRIHSRFQMIDSHSSKLSKIMEFVSFHADKYDVCMYDCYDSIKCQLDTNNLFIYALINKDEPDEIVAVYIFKNPRVTIMQYNVITCIGSIKGNVTDEVFYYVFLKMIHKIPVTNKMLAIENTADNNILLQKMIHPKPIFTTKNAYFLYNYTCSPVLSNKCLILI